MVSASDIQSTCDDIVREFSPMQVILFGSYAYGTPTEDSDVDMFVVMEGLKSDVQRQAWEMQKQLPQRFPLDLHARCPADIAYRVAHNDWFLREIFEKGEVLYETAGLPQLGFAADALVPMWQETGVMNPLTLERVRTAEADYMMMNLGVQASTDAVYDPICFHAQQCVEKYLKAWLQEANIPIPRTHDLNALLVLIVPTHPQWRAWQSDFEKFKPHAVDVRYEEYTAEDVDVEHAVRICTEVRREIRATLQLPNDENDAQEE